MDEAEYCSRISIMKQGKIVELANPHRLKERYGAQSMQEVFLKAVKGRTNETHLFFNIPQRNNSHLPRHPEPVHGAHNA